MATTAQFIDQYIPAHLDTTLDELKRLCAQPSVSARREGVDDCAALVAEILRGHGFAAQVFQTPGHPVVVGTARGHSARTLLFYNHYDVQPPEPLELWVSPPFEPTRRDGRLYARGISDDKGQLVSRIAAMRAVRGVTGGLPARVKFLVEGEEEISSPSLEPFVEQHRDLLAADACVWEFGGVDHEGRPEVVLGLRGICYVEFRVRTLSRDAHSGEAHNLPNAAWRLIWALGSIKGPDERIRIPGFYDSAAPPTESDLRLLDAMPSNEAYTRETYGVREFVGDHTGDAYKRAVYNPTANVAGFGSGWQGKGSKTVTPAEATAKMDFRLVPGQDPRDVLAKLRAHLDDQGFGDVEVTYLGGERAGTTPPEEPFVQLTVRTAAEVYDKPVVVKPLIGGSGPMHAFREYLGTPIVTLGCGDPESRAHSPNESIAIEGFARATRHMAHLLLEYGEDGDS
ncbi:MAG TPA: M20/M25/M40 family metallo-hydrolase [Ktedonobacterales bacterium]|nr:M20/M25/M40 family metallo-hydrolase [Ktedonobacterales bacterium]